MKLVIKYGFHDPRCEYVYISDKLNIKNVAKLIMDAKEASEYTVDDEISDDDGENHFWIKYKVPNWPHECRMEIKVNHLLEIDGKLFELPPWGMGYRATTINKKMTH